MLRESFPTWQGNASRNRIRTDAGSGFVIVIIIILGVNPLWSQETRSQHGTHRAAKQAAAIQPWFLTWSPGIELLFLHRRSPVAVGNLEQDQGAHWQFLEPKKGCDKTGTMKYGVGKYSATLLRCRSGLSSQSHEFA
jgi:hypothetical protein